MSERARARLWHLQPRIMKKLRLFLAIVWREHYGSPMTVGLSWDVAGKMHPRRERRVRND